MTYTGSATGNKILTTSTINTFVIMIPYIIMFVRGHKILGELLEGGQDFHKALESYKRFFFLLQYFLYSNYLTCLPGPVVKVLWGSFYLFSYSETENLKFFHFFRYDLTMFLFLFRSFAINNNQNDVLLKSMFNF